MFKNTCEHKYIYTCLMIYVCVCMCKCVAVCCSVMHTYIHTCIMIYVCMFIYVQNLRSTDMRSKAIMARASRITSVRTGTCVLQCVAACYRVLQCVAECCRVLQCVAVCCSVLQCVAVCCSVLQCVAVCGYTQYKLQNTK